MSASPPKADIRSAPQKMLECFSARSRVCSPSHLTTTAEVLLRADLYEGGGGGGDHA